MVAVKPRQLPDVDRDPGIDSKGPQEFFNQAAVKIAYPLLGELEIVSQKLRPQRSTTTWAKASSMGMIALP